jgi:hypothetical protein
MNMTVQEFHNLLLTADPQATHNRDTGGGNFTVWQEYSFLPYGADGRYQEWRKRIQVDRFTKMEYDPIVDRIAAVLDIPEIAFTIDVDYEQDTGYQHYIFDCEVA